MREKAEQMELLAEERAARGRQVKQLRQQGWVPAVLYGRQFDPLSLKIEEVPLRRLLSEVGGSQLVRVNVKGMASPELALVRDVQRDPLRGDLLHVDLYRVMMTETLTTEVPLNLVGESLLADRSDALLLTGLTSVEVQCLPGDLVDAIDVDLSVLTEVDQALLVRDLTVPDGIEILTDPDEMIARAVHARMAVPEVEPEVEELEEVEELVDVVEIAAPQEDDEQD